MLLIKLHYPCFLLLGTYCFHKSVGREVMKWTQVLQGSEPPLIASAVIDAPPSSLSLPVFYQN